MANGVHGTLIASSSVPQWNGQKGFAACAFSINTPYVTKNSFGLERELNRLHQAQGITQSLPLERPYQRGWVKSYTLREDALHHPDIRFFAAVLKVVNQKVYAKKREFISRCGEEMVLHPRIISSPRVG